MLPIKIGMPKQIPATLTPLNLLIHKFGKYRLMNLSKTKAELPHAISAHIYIWIVLYFISNYVGLSGPT